MGHVVDIFRVVPQLISQRIDDVLDEKKYRFTFKHYVDRNNIEEQRLQNPLDAYTIVNKIKTDLYQLNKDEWMEVLLWLKETASEAYKHDFEFEVPEVSAHIAQYGLAYIERIGDRSHSFSFTLGDFLSDYYNDFYDEYDNKLRESCCLSAEDFKIFIIYGLHLFAGILLTEKPSTYSSYEEMVGIVNLAITDEKLKAVVDDNLNYITENKESTKTDADDTATSTSYANYWCDLDEFEYLFYRFQTFWEDYKDNDMSVIILM